MNGIHIKFYMHENRKHNGILLYEWLLEKAQELGIHGGSVFRAVAGYGRHGVIHEEHFFELAANVPVEAAFIVSPEECQRLMQAVQRENLDIFYVKTLVEYGTLRSDAAST